MRIQIRLSYEAQVLLAEKKIECLKLGDKVTSGQVIDELVTQFKDYYNDINWLHVKNAEEYADILSKYKQINPTTLNITDETVKFLSNFVEYLNNELGMRRTVYRSFALRMLLKASKLEETGKNIRTHN